jgi:putative N6-adenine-specific DNA methylase
MTDTAKALARRIRQHVTGREHRLFAVMHPGFEETAAAELRSLGVASTLDLTEGGVEFDGKLEDVYRVNYAAYTPTRLLMRLTVFRAEEFTRLRAKALEFPWELHLAGGAPLSFSITCRHSRLYHTGRIEQEIRAAVSQRFSAAGLLVPQPGDEAGGAQVFVRFQDDICTLSLDSTGEPLYRRGYRTHVVDAPLRETLAACILRAASLETAHTLIDPMCGSGTFSLEASLMSAGRPAGETRAFAFESWPAFRPAAFGYLKKNFRSPGAAHGSLRIVCGDTDDRALSATIANAQTAGMTSSVSPVKLDFFEYVPDTAPDGGTLLVLNPPYGGRMGSRAELIPFYKTIGAKVKEAYAAARFAIIAPGQECERALDLPFSRKILFMNGGIKVALLVKDAQD